MINVKNPAQSGEQNIEPRNIQLEGRSNVILSANRGIDLKIYKMREILIVHSNVNGEPTQTFPSKFVVSIIKELIIFD